MKDTGKATMTVAEAYLRLLKKRGVDYLFANAGTDFAPIIEALAGGGADRGEMPHPVIAPHENVAVAMAMGHALISGRPQAVMVHVNVGTANALCGLMNASRLHVPMLFTAGRTPILEEGAPGARSGFIHWPQEMFDQGGIVREMVRWDYELRDPRQLRQVVDRALAICRSSPAGPVYLTLPREVLAAPVTEIDLEAAPALAPVSAGRPPESALQQVAGWIGTSRRPLLITSATGRTAAARAALEAFAAEHRIPVVTYTPRFAEISHDHPMNAGSDPNPLLGEADLVLVSEAMAPWIPGQASPGRDCRVVQIGEDPLFADLPMRSFPAHVALSGAPAEIFSALQAMARGDTPEAEAGRARDDWAARTTANARVSRTVETLPDDAPPPPSEVTRAIAEIRGGAPVFKESPLLLGDLGDTETGDYFFAGAAGGLGWSMGAALGASLARGRKPVIVTTGDGSYMFNTPLAAHHVAASEGIPLLTVIYNNNAWHAVRRATHGMYPDGAAKAACPEPLTDFGVDFNYSKMMEVAGGHGERVDRMDELRPALKRAMAAVEVGGQALVDVRIAHGRKS
ncbi:thiamine pyrophosphate-requiring protein [Alkalilacustris brevis]|uniref:thiamine pyrophosphate-requiring protein n=1 Tax=Alkalilacustris brevis TaxID=2026338 RepID=UPI000E0D18A7|nr:thiamine pyrophosphate-requiring protein [Alkalilacustris brevis]